VAKNNRVVLPFAPSFSQPTANILGRKQILDYLVTELNNIGSQARTTMVTGVRGVGKTTLLLDLQKAMSEKKDWIVVRQQLREFPEDYGFTKQLIHDVLKNSKKYDVHQKWFAQLKNWKFSVSGTSIEYLGKGEQQNFQDELDMILSVLTKHHIGVLFLTDEVAESAEFANFVAMYQLMVGNGYDVAMIGAGIPENVADVFSGRMSTFLMRAKKIFLQNISIQEVAQSYISIFKMNGRDFDLSALTRAAVLTNGYPYMYQLMGDYFWRLDHKITLEDVSVGYERQRETIYNDVLSIIYKRLKGKTKDFVLSMAEVMDEKGRAQISDIGSAMERPKNYISVYRDKLINEGLICSVEHGVVAFTVPFMKDYLEQQKILEEFE
jgi:Cdc6-like AAA superfamily ATPase